MEWVLRAMGGRRGRVLVVVLRRRCSDERTSESLARVCLAASARARLSAVPNAVTAWLRVRRGR
jgi:hypothetical protein